MRLLLTFLIVLSLAPSARADGNRGIRFFRGTWQEACRVAAEEGKLVFADFYTRWCGPCLHMAEEVFPLSFVGDFYNEHFVCVKIDAERGEGVELAERYGVRSYPAYVFADPETGEAVHRSGSRQSAEQFLATGENALRPETRSGYLLEGFAAGRSDREFLENYIRYAASVCDRDGVAEAFARLTEGGASLTEPDVWALYEANISGTDNPYFREMAENYARFAEKVGKERVDAKLRAETRHAPEALLDSLPDFEGKRLNLRMARIDALVRERDYDAADAAIREAMADTLVDRQAFIDQFRYTVRSACWREDTPLSWLSRCASYMQYIAYNDDDRQDASIHQEYAALLERLIRLAPGAEEVFPASILDKPEFGVQDYSLRPRNLAPKPAGKAAGG